MQQNTLARTDIEWNCLALLATGRKFGADDTALISTLDVCDFTDAGARRIFEAIRTLQQRHEVVGLAAIDLAINDPELQQKLLAACAEHARDGFMLARYVAELKRATLRRRLDGLASELSAAAFDGDADLERTVDQARASLRGAIPDDGQWITAGDAAIMANEAAEGGVEPIPTGFKELDLVLCGGLMRPEMTIVGARPGRGKSAFLLAVAQHAARAGQHVAFYSLEMSGVQIGQRILSSAACVSVSKQRAGRKALNDEDWAALAGGLTVIGNDGVGDHLHIRCEAGLTIEKLERLCADAADRGQLDLVVVDYLQLLRTGQRTTSDFERLGIVSRSLKQMALRLDVPVLAAAQVRRQDSRGGALRAPGLDELRGSGDLEQDADAVLLIHIPETADDDALKCIGADNPHYGIFDRATDHGYLPFSLDVAKQRQGANRRTWFLFEPKYMRFWPDGGVR